MSSIKKIYLDMDGVLVDDLGMYDLLQPGNSDLILKATVMGNKNKVVFPMIYECIDKGLFQDAPITPFGVTVALSYIPVWQSKGIEVEILTSTMERNDKREYLEQQKLAWLKEHNFNVKVNFSKGSREKKHFAEEGSLLIDDYDRNIKEWLEAGGHAIHHTNEQNTYKLFQLLNIGLQFSCLN